MEGRIAMWGIRSLQASNFSRWSDKRKRGVVLIFAFAILMTLSSIGLLFVLISQLEHTSATIYLQRTDAKFIAMSGIEYAVSQLQERATRVAWDGLYDYDPESKQSYRSNWAYLQESFYDENLNGRYDLNERVFEDLDGNEQYSAFPKLEQTSEPSFKFKRSDGQYGQLRIKGEEKERKKGNIGYTNELGSRGNQRGFISVKVRDMASMVWINGPLEEGTNLLAPNVVAILNQLGDILMVRDKSGKFMSINEYKNIKLGDRINKIREQMGGNFTSKLELKQNPRVNPTLLFSDEEYDVIKEYLTPWMWVDYDTVNPLAFRPIAVVNENDLENNRQLFINDKTININATPYVIIDTNVAKAVSRAQSYLEPTGSMRDLYFSIGSRRASLASSEPNLLRMFGMCPAVLMQKKYASHGQAVVEIVTGSSEEKSASDILMDRYSEVTMPPLPIAPIPIDREFLLLQPRAPININTAPREILVAVLTGIQGWTVTPGTIENPIQFKTLVNPGKAILSEKVSIEQASRLADHIIAYRRKQPFTNWNQFERFIMGGEEITKFDENYPVGGGLDPKLGFLDHWQKQAIFANANPNTRMGDFNPDEVYNAPFVAKFGNPKLSDYYSQPLLGHIDKTKLRFWTTEFCFSSMGYFEIESVGMIGKVKTGNTSGVNVVEIEPLAESRISVDVKLWDVYRHSSQRDFVLSSFQTINGQLRRVNSRVEGMPSAHYTVSYPENVMNSGNISSTGSVEEISLPSWGAASYEGYIGLMPFSSPPRPEGKLLFQADFTKGLVPEYAAYLGGTIGTIEDGRSLVEPGEDGKGIYPPGGAQNSPMPKPPLYHLIQNSVFVDGLFVHETKRYPYFYDTGEYQQKLGHPYMYGWCSKEKRFVDEYIGYPCGADVRFNVGKMGAIEFWVKPTWSYSDQAFNEDLDTRTFISLGNAEGYSISSITSTVTTQGGGGQEVIEWVPDYQKLNYLQNFMSAKGDPICEKALEQAYQVAVKIGPEILYPKETSEWGKWEMLRDYIEKNEGAIAFDPNSAHARSRNAAIILGRILYRTRTNVSDVQQLKHVEEKIPTERLTVFARSREVAAFISKNYTPTSGANTFGNFAKASVPLGSREGAGTWQWRAGTWHHIAVSWGPPSGNQNDKWMVNVYLDGVRAPNPYTTSILKLNPKNSIFIGTNRFGGNISNGYPLTADATIANLRIYDNNLVFPVNDGFTPPDRYAAQYGAEQTYWRAKIADFTTVEKFYGRLGTVSWTERIPKRDIPMGSSGGDITILVGFTGLGEEKGKFPQGADLIGSDKAGCKSVSEQGRLLSYEDLEECPSLNGGGFPFALIPSAKKPVSTDQAKGLYYEVHFSPPDVTPVVQSPILEDITITFITPVQVLWHVPEEEL